MELKIGDRVRLKRQVELSGITYWGGTEFLVASVVGNHGRWPRVGLADERGMVVIPALSVGRIESAQ